MAAGEREPRTFDRYTLHGVIASGGMASVHFGRLVGAHGFARTVAIKRLHPQFAMDPEFSSMLLDEARLAVRIRHPNVVATLDSVQADGELFLVMEYIAGESLAVLIREAGKKGGRVPPPIGSAILAGALAGLHAAHEATAEDGAALQIVHRDVSPQNILVGEDGIARVLDFGIARAAVRSQVSREGQLKGKLSYMAPEQLRGGPLTRRTDIYAAAVVLWEVLTGRRLFTGDSDAAIFGRILEGVIQPPSAFGDFSEELDRVVLRGLERDPERRYATALEMAAALEAALPPAGPRAVGAWVEETAAALLAERARRLAEIETSQRSPAVTTAGPSSPAVVDRRLLRAIGPRPSQPPGGLAGEPRSSVTLPTLTRTVEDMARPMPVALVTAAPAAPRSRRGARIARASALAAAAGSLVLAALAGQRCGVLPELAAPSPEPAPVGAPSPASAPVGAPSPPAEPPAVAPAEAPAAPSSAAEPGRASAAAGAPEAPPGATAAASATAAAQADAAARRAEPGRTGAARPTAPARSARPRCVPPYYVDAKGIRRIKRECL